MLLALDTSTSSAGLALVAQSDAPRTVAEHNWEVGQRHSVELLPRLEALLAGAGVRWDQLTGMAVATGPGSFNGLRVALSTAKALCLALGLPLYGVPTLDVAAWGYAYADAPLWALLEAGRGQLYTARYFAPAASAEEWGPLGGYELLRPEELAMRIGDEQRGALLVGEWRPGTRTALEALLADAAVRFASPLALRRGVWLAELALARAARGLRDDPASLEPLYLRRPAITSSTKRGLAPANGASHSSTEREEGFHALQH
jgi:tRNA threonylcarbamoyladenosine biosynthesis protein TsaB